jgi:hypothetical protein
VECVDPSYRVAKKELASRFGRMARFTVAQIALPVTALLLFVGLFARQSAKDHGFDA